MREPAKKRKKDRALRKSPGLKEKGRGSEEDGLLSLRSQRAKANGKGEGGTVNIRTGDAASTGEGGVKRNQGGKNRFTSSGEKDAES